MSVVDPAYPDEVSRWMLDRNDIVYLRSLYAEQWTPEEPTEIVFPSGLTVPRASLDTFLEYFTVRGRARRIPKQLPLDPTINHGGQQ